MQIRVPNYRTMALVSGYHACSYPPPIAYDAGLRERFAVILSTYRPEKGEMFFDADLFLLVTGAFLRVIAHETLAIEIGGTSSALHSLPELTECYARQDETDRAAPLRIKVYAAGRLVALVETEWWASVGGPAPYHDSYTLSFYTADNRTAEFRSICERIAGENGVIITAYYEAVPRKKPFLPWWRRPLRWLRRLFLGEP